MNKNLQISIIWLLIILFTPTTIYSQPSGVHLSNIKTFYNWQVSLAEEKMSKDVKGTKYVLIETEVEPQTKFTLLFFKNGDVKAGFSTRNTTGIVNPTNLGFIPASLILGNTEYPINGVGIVAGPYFYLSLNGFPRDFFDILLRLNNFIIRFAMFQYNISLSGFKQALNYKNQLMKSL